MVLIDTDMIATRPLGELIEAAAGGRVVAFRNDRQRFFAQWERLLDLPAMRHGPYVSSGLVLLGGRAGRQALELLDDRQRRVEIERSFAGSNESGYPFLYPEQDVLNAILLSALEPESVAALPWSLAPTPPFDRIEITDLQALRCRDRDGVEPFVLHHFVRKPWLERVYHGPYSRLLARLLLGSDAPLRPPPEEVPRRLRGGVRGSVERTAVNAIDLARWYARDVIAERWRARRAAGAGKAGRE